MPSNELPQELTDYNPTIWTAGQVIKASELRNIEKLVDILTDQVLNIDNRLVEFLGATSSANGVKGIVPAPEITDKDKYLKGDRSWETPAIRYNNNDNTILEGTGSLNITGTITGQTFSGSGANLTNIPGTEVGLASSDAAGAMSSADKIKLDELPTNTQLLTNYVSKSSVSDASGIPNADTTLYGLVKIGSNINVDNGTISVPLATSSVSGIVSIGNGLSIDNGIISNNLNIKNSTGTGSIVEGMISGSFINRAYGDYAHAEGESTAASGKGAHAEGTSTNARGNYSHAEGNGTTTTHRSLHVFGEYNILDTPTPDLPADRGTYIEIVGNGHVNAKSNARTLDWEGNEWLAGNITATNYYRNLDNTPLGIKKIWVNGSPESSFSHGPLTISGGLSQYKLLLLVAKYHDSSAPSAQWESTTALVPVIASRSFELNWHSGSAYYDRASRRFSITADYTGIYFDYGYYYNYASSYINGQNTPSSTPNNAVVIPYIIYGINLPLYES